MKNKNNTRNTIIGLTLLAVAVLGMFIAAINVPEKEEPVQMTAATKQLTKDYEKAYPSTPKSVMTEYGEITKCFYASDTEEAQLRDLCAQMRMLFDDELVANQSFDDFYDSLRSEVAVYKDAGKIVSSYSVSSSTDVKYSETEYGSLATLYFAINLRENGKINRIREQFVLRKDKAGHWKILGWQKAESDE